MLGVQLLSLCRALLVLDVAYCVAAQVTPGLPGWDMFVSVEHPAYTLRAGDGRAIDAYAWVPASARDLDERDLVDVARWLCRGRRETTPLRFDGPSLHRVIDAPGCVDHAAP
jgi:hypothetical protein